MYKTLIIDDNCLASERLKEFISIESQNFSVLPICSTLESALLTIKVNNPDIVFIDTNMNNGSVFDFFRHFKKPAFKVIIITENKLHGVEAFRYPVLDFVLKPLDPEIISDALTKAVNLIRREKENSKLNSFINSIGNSLKRIVLKTSESIHLVEIADIVYCKSDHCYTHFFLKDKSRILVSRTIGEYEDLLSDHGFIRIHQSYLINLIYLKRFEKAEGGKVVLRNDFILPVASRKKEFLIKRLNQF